MSDDDLTVFRDLFDHAFDALWVVDETMVIEHANDAACALTGYAHDELVGQPLTLILPDDIASRHDGYVQNYRERSDGQTVLGAARRFTLKARNGEKVPIQLKAFELDERGHGNRFGAIMVDLRETVRMEREQQRIMAQLERLALIDPLTELWNRRAFDDALARQQALISRHEGVASVALVDVDHFKAVNDTHGHHAGDQVLQQLASTLKGMLRHEDVCGRLGGEEIGILMPATEPEKAFMVMERALLRVATAPFELDDGLKIRISFSAGVAALDGQISGAEALERADAAMYRAKENGRARIEIWEPEEQVAAPTA